MIIRNPLPNKFRPDNDRLVNLIKSKVLGGFDPLALSPNLALDASLSGSEALVAGGAEAGFLDLVATFGNPGDGSDATQMTAASQPINLPLIDGLPYGYCPGVSQNYFSFQGVTLDVSSPWFLECDFVFTGEVTSLFGLPDSLPGILSIDSSIINLFIGGASDGVNSWRSISHGWASGERHVIRVEWDGVNTVEVFSDGVSYGTRVLSAPETIVCSAQGIDRVSPPAGRCLAALKSANVNDVVKIDYTKATHGATSLTAETGQTVTLNRTGNNPAAFIGKPRGRLDGADDFWEIADGSIPLNAVSGATLMWHGTLNSVSGINDLVLLATPGGGSRASISIVNGVVRIAGRRLDSDSFASLTGGSVAQYEKTTIAGVFDYANATATIYKNGAQVFSGPFQTAGTTSATDSPLVSVGSGNQINHSALDTGQAYIYEKALTAAEVFQWHNYASAR